MIMRTSTTTTVVTLTAATTTELVSQSPHRVAIILSAQVDTSFLHESAPLATGGILLTPLGISYLILTREQHGDIVTRPWFARQVVSGSVTVVEILEVPAP